MSFQNHEPFAQITGPAAASFGIYQNWLKRPVDLALIVFAIPVLLPLAILIGCLIRSDGGPALYSQLRIGRGGRAFRCWKFRTMVMGADTQLARLLADDPALAREWQRSQKLRHDPRITRLGRFLRRSSLDELPQLWNVLRGDMSLIGPRPFLPNQRDLYDRHRQTVGYYHLRPGLTGLWQVSDRNLCGFEGRVAYDDVYYRKISPAHDLHILLKTFRAISGGTGT
ncbi:MAG: sugar transferase [Paracoccaceae bacterium]|nr:sugar transferase [Paracoccaceae bacterium]